ncbi:MAG: presenilin family intramembrane aspartyl protease [Candidatus Anstonellales archaeon]
MSKVTFSIILMFALAQVIGIFTGIGLIGLARVEPQLMEFNISPTEDVNSISNAFFIFIYMMVGAAALFVVLKVYKGIILFNIINFLVVFLGSNVVFLVMFNHFDIPFNLSILYSILVSLLLAGLNILRSEINNFAAIISSSGVGALFGFSIGFYPAIVLVVLLAIYDYWAVFKTKHMIKFATEFGKRKLPFFVSSKETRRIKEKLESSKGVVEVEKEVEGGSISLGTGDIAIPVMLAVSSYDAFGFEGVIAVFIGCVFGLSAIVSMVYKNRIFLPAIPPICLGGLLSLLVLEIVRSVILF